MHLLAAFVGASEGVIDKFISEHREAQRFDPVHGVTVLTVGQPGSTLGFWRIGDRLVAGFGSAVKFLSSTAVDDLMRSIDGPGNVPAELTDIVILSASADEQLTAVTGSGAHRFFKRKLPSGGTMLSTHLGSVVTVDVPAAIDRTYEDFFLGFGFHPDGRTMFDGIQQLPVLSRWTSEAEVAQTLEVATSPAEGEFDSGPELLDLLLAAVDRQVGDINHCAVLLGGFDSALVCALLNELGKKVTAFTFDFGEQQFNQTNIDMVTDWLNIDHQWVPIDAHRMMAGLQRLPDLLNAPGAQPHYQLHTVFASEAVEAAGFQMAMTGDGCDAIFLGYPTIYRRSSLMTRLQRLPAPSRRAMLGLLGLRSLDRSLGHVARTGRSALRASMLSYPASGHLPTQYLDEVSLRRLRLGPEFQLSESIDDTRLRLATGLRSDSPAYLAFLGYGATGSSRIKVDGSVMRTGIAQFTPFKDPAVARFAKELPQSELRPDNASDKGLGKQYLIDAVIDAGVLPPEVVLQPKQSPSTSPIDYWYMGELREGIMDLLESLPFEWDREYVENLLRPKRAEEWYRRRVALSPHALQAVGLLASYAAFAKLSR